MTHTRRFSASWPPRAWCRLLGRAAEGEAYSEGCTEGDIAHVQITINGAPVQGKLLQTTSLEEPFCAILIFDPQRP